MAEAAEQLTQPYFVSPELGTYEPALKIVEVPMLMQDEILRTRANRFIGSIALQAILEPSPPNAETIESTKFNSLLEALLAAQQGNQLATSLVSTNVATHLAETMFKVGPVKPIEQTMTDDGIYQFGQSDLQVQANTLRYSDDNEVMRARSEAETRNTFRKQSFADQGLLEDNYMVVVSRPEDLPEAGFFTDTMSISIQLTSTQGSVVTIESAFVAGKPTPEAESRDEAIVEHLGNSLKVDYSGKTPAEIIDRPLLIPKSLLPNGVIDLVKICDALHGTFYGEAKTAQDYDQHRADHFAHQASFTPRVKFVTEQLISGAHCLNDPVEATERLHKLSESELVEVAVLDTRINPLVLGSVSARHVEMARVFIENGDMIEAITSTQSAKKTAQSSSCPSSLRLAASSDSSTGESDTKPTGKKEKMKCPFCGDPDQSGDPCSPNQHCNNCDARVANGKVVSTGNGGKKQPTKITKLRPVPAKAADIEAPKHYVKAA